MATRRTISAEDLRGPAIATTYEHAGSLRGHHVRRTETELFACVEHLVTNCVDCGRTPGEHALDAAGEKARGRELGCPKHRKRKRAGCQCGLPRGAAI